MNLIIKIRNIILGGLYRQILKRALFMINPEKVHDRFIKVGSYIGASKSFRLATKALYGYSHPSLSQTILGITFENPIGLSAGFDKNAVLTDIIPSVGFGFEEIGSITARPYEGNPGIRLWRLPKSKSLAVYYGLMNDGADAISAKLKDKRFNIPTGISVAKTNCKENCDVDEGVRDYVYTYRSFSGIGHYDTINISCPNVFGGQPFHDSDSLKKLLEGLSSVPKTKPMFIKISPDLSADEVDGIIKTSKMFDVDGFIISNLTKPRNNPNIKDVNVPDVGGLSGKVVEHLANNLIKYVHSRVKGEFIIIGCGGVFSAEDAYKKIRLGASLVQLITGMIYQGPQVVSEINQGLVRLLERDGFKNISEAVGVDV